ncbi:MAG: helix-turn-helix domain-containing protein, partial [Planctomycetota bacterium]
MKARVRQDQQGRKSVTEACDAPCPIERGMRILGGKWTGSILWHLKDDPVRFNDLARMISGASKKMIAERLRQLEGRGLIER